MFKIKINYFIGIIVSFLFYIRFFNVLNTDVGFDKWDSPTYFKPTLNHPIRMPQISFLFTTIEYYGGIIIVQTLFSILCWALLIYSITKLIDNTYISIFGIALIFSLSISRPVVEHDTLVLSESLTISLLVGIVASLIIFLNNPNLFTSFMHCFFIFLFSGTKQSSAHLSALLSFVFLILVLKFVKIPKSHTIIIILASFNLVICLLSLSIARQNEEHDKNLAISNIVEKTYDDFKSQSWWLERGFPSIAYQLYSSPPFQTPVNMVRSSPQVKAWEQFESHLPTEGYALSHPTYLLFAPLDPKNYINTFTDSESVIPALAKGTQVFENPNYTNLVSGEYVPSFLEKLNLTRTFWWSTSSAVSKIFLVSFLFVILVYQVRNLFKRFSSKQNLIINFYFGIFVLAVWANWHVSVAYELTRYIMPWAILLRIIFVFSIIVLIEEFAKSSRLFKLQN